MHTLDIYLGERRVGTITNLDNDHNVFVFDQHYANDPDRPVLSLGFYNATGEFAPGVPAPQLRLLPFFANLLPEGHLREYIANSAHVNLKRDFPMLWLVGEDLPGAVIARHPDGATPAADYPEPVVDEKVEHDPDVLKFSLAGVQLKFSALREADGGLTIPVHGKGGQWIVKMPSAIYPNVPENEFSMLTFARRVGIDVPEIGLLNAAEVGNMPPEVRTDLGNAMYIKRFDRNGEHRIHIEDFAQIFNQYPGDKYKNVSYANMLNGIWRAMGEEQAKEFIRRLIFNIAIGNGDMHLKNWSVIYADGKKPELSPAYDYVSTVVYIPNDKLGLTIARTKEWENVDEALLERFARRAAVPRGVVLNTAQEMVERVRGEWPHLNDAKQLSQAMSQSIEDHMMRVPLLNKRKAHPVSVQIKTSAESSVPQPEIA